MVSDVSFTIDETPITYENSPNKYRDNSLKMRLTSLF